MFRALLAASVFLPALAAQGPITKPPPKKPDGKLLFLTVCATCHGQDGKGDGPLKVVPTPRDLTSGKFSFGNTKQAILHTVANGIPPAMPPHKDLLTEAQRLAVVEYVLTLMPEQIEMPERLSKLVVGAQPIFVQGILERHPHGLVLGLPGGITLAYDTENLRMLGIHEGEFVDRTDWRERGGTPLALLGKPWKLPDLLPFPGMRLALRATEALAGTARIEFDVRTSPEAKPIRGTETIRWLPVRDGKVVVREIELSAPLALQEAEQTSPDGDHETLALLRKRDAQHYAFVLGRAAKWTDALRVDLEKELAR